MTHAPAASPAAAVGQETPPRRAPGYFEDVTEAAGLDVYLTRGRPTPHQRLLLETKGGGAAWIDYDGDGWLDVYLVNGNDPSSDGPQPGNFLFRNRGDGTFEDVTAHAGAGCSRYGYGVAVGDYDNDGWDDIYVTNYRRNTLYRNNGDGTFTDVTEAAGVGDHAHWGASAAFADINRDGWLDLYVTNYFVLDVEHPPGGGGLCLFNEILAPCGPIGMTPEPDVLYLNNGNGTFADISEASGIRSVENAFGLGVIFRDFDNDGWDDIYVANDMYPNRLFRNTGGLRFEEIGLICGAALSESGKEQAGMGVDAADVDGDTWQEILVGNYTAEDCGYYRNDRGALGELFFVHASSRAGISAGTYHPLTFGAKFFDADNSGDLDIFFANGHVHPNVEGKQDTGFAQRNQLFMHAGPHRFREAGREAGPGLDVVAVSRAAAFGDYDNNGSVDILVVNLNAAPTLLRNGEPAGGTANWLMVLAAGRTSNTGAIGAVITVEAGGRTWRREVRRDGSYCASHDPRIHFGLGAIERIDRLMVAWPAGGRSVREALAVNQLVHVIEGDP